MSLPEAPESPDDARAAVEAPAVATAPVREPQRIAFVTIALVAANALAFLGEWTSGTDFFDSRSLYDRGALFGLAVRQGEWWRVVTGAFLHAGPIHLGMNMLALYAIGRDLEWLVGGWRMLAIYAISLVAGGYAVVAFAPDTVTVGASGAVFGLFGALVACGLRMGAAGRGIVKSVIPVIVVNLALTFAIPFISKAGHIGGLVAGFVVGAALFRLHPTAERHLRGRAAAIEREAVASR